MNRLQVVEYYTSHGCVCLAHEWYSIVVLGYAICVFRVCVHVFLFGSCDSLKFFQTCVCVMWIAMIDTDGCCRGQWVSFPHRPRNRHNPHNCRVYTKHESHTCVIPFHSIPPFQNRSLSLSLSLINVSISPFMRQLNEMHLILSLSNEYIWLKLTLVNNWFPYPQALSWGRSDRVLACPGFIFLCLDRLDGPPPPCLAFSWSADRRVWDWSSFK